MSLSLQSLPALNAVLNGIATCFLVGGFVFIKQRRVHAHRACMLAAFFVSAAFLVSYLYYHFHHPTTRFTTPGWPKVIYLSILATHVVGAILNLPLILITLALALRQRWTAHRRLARWTWPLWFYVSVTGVLVYLMLYQIWPPK